MTTPNIDSRMNIPGGKPGAIADYYLFDSLLRAMRAALRRTLGYQNIRISSSDKYKSQLKQADAMNYPRGYILITNVKVLREQNNVAINRQGYVSAYKATPREMRTIGVVDGLDARTVKVAQVWQTELDIEFHHVETDRIASLKAMNNMLVMIAANSLSIQIEVDEWFRYHTMLKFDPNVVPFGEQNHGDESNPATIDLAFSGTIRGYVGNVYQVMRALKIDSPMTALQIQEDFPKRFEVTYDKLETSDPL